MENLEKLYINIKTLRTSAGIGQCELARAIGVAQSNIVRWEQGRQEPKASHLIAIARYFGVTTDYLLGLEE